MKIPAKNFKGIAYVQLNELPVVQQELILQTVHKDLFIKILIGEKIVGSCLQYSDYERWYSNVFKINTSVSPVPETLKRSEVLNDK
jgi:hypothetical protein